MLRAEPGQHTLSCSACGAPLRRLKMLPMATPTSKTAVTHQPRNLNPAFAKVAKPEKKRKKRKGFLRKLAEEAFDVIEDIFD